MDDIVQSQASAVDAAGGDQLQPLDAAIAGTPSYHSLRLKYPTEITQSGLLERCISSSSWADNVLEARKASLYRPLESDVTYDAENITPSESVVFIQARPPSAPNINFRDSEAYSTCSNVPTRAIPSLRAASEIMNSIASSSLLQYTIFSKRNLTPLFLSSSKHGDFGGRKIKLSKMRQCFAKEKEVESLLKELEERKINAAKAFVDAIKNKSVVNVALAAWNSGNAANLQRLVEFSKLKYGPRQVYKNAGLYRVAPTERKKAMTTQEFMVSIISRHKGPLTFDSASSVFNTALARVFKEFLEAVNVPTTEAGDLPGPLFSAVRQRRLPHEDYKDLGVLTPRRKFSEGKYVFADKGSGDAGDLSMIASDFETLRGGRKRSASVGAAELRDTLAQSVLDSAIDPNKIKSVVDLTLDMSTLERSMHITQLFGQAFMEAMSSNLSFAFGIRNPFSDEGFEAMANALRKGKREMNPSILADEYLLLTGNFQIPFHVSDPHDIVEGRQVCPNTPILTITTRYYTPENEIVTEIEFRDRLLVKDTLLNEAIDGTLNTPPALRNEPSSSGEDKVPMLGGSVPIIRGPQTFKRKTDVDGVINSLANDWFISIGVYYSVGKTKAAICAGFRRAIASAEDLISRKQTVSKTRKRAKEEARLKRNMRCNADRSARLSLLLGQTVSQYEHQEHNSTLYSFWSSSAAVRSKMVGDALARSRVLGVRRQLDGKEDYLDGMNASEQAIRNGFFQNVIRDASYDLDKSTNLLPGLLAFEHWFKEDVMSTSNFRERWAQYTMAMGNLAEHENKVFKVSRFFLCLKKFRFPLVPSDHHGHRHRRTNLRATNLIINGLTEMTIQSAFNATSSSRIGVGIGSAADGWNGFNNQLEPSRMRALKTMAKFKRGRLDVISIPVSRSHGSISGVGPSVTTVDIPTVIVSYLISDKQILDALCGRKENLQQVICDFIRVLSGGSVTELTSLSPIFTDPTYSIMLLRYMWFNTAIISITDTNIIHMAMSEVDSNLGVALYQDFLSIKSLVNNFNNSLRDFSIDAVADHLLGSSKSSEYNSDNVSIKDKKELQQVLQQTTDALSAFTNKTEGVTASKENMSTVIKPLPEPQKIMEMHVTVIDIDKLISVDKLIALIEFLQHIQVANSNWETPLRRLALGKGSTKSELGDYSPPDITSLFQQELGVTGVAKNSPLGTTRDITIDLNVTHPLILSANRRYIQKRLSVLNTVLDDKVTDTITAEIQRLNQEANVDTLPSLKNTIKIPAHLTPAEATNIVKAFTSDGANSNQTTHLGLVKEALEKFKKVLEGNIKENTLKVTLEEVKSLAGDVLLICLVCIHSRAGRNFVNLGVSDLSKFLVALLAEASLAISRLQSSFYPLHPSFLSIGALFKPNKHLFDDTVREFTAAIIKELTTAFSRDAARHCDDGRQTSSKIYYAGKAYNEDNTPIVKKGVTGEPETITPSKETGIEQHLRHPIDVWSPLALTHFDVALVPRHHVNLSHDQLLKLSSFYQGMHKLSSDPECGPEKWDNELPGNKAGRFFGLEDVSNNTRSFSSALDTVFAFPADFCDIVTREVVGSSCDVIHNIGSAQNTEKLNRILAKGISSVRKPSTPSPSPVEFAIRETISALSRNKYGETPSSEGHMVASQMVKTWNTLSLLDRRDSGNHSTGDNDIVRIPLVAVPAFRQNVVEATRSAYELAAICSSMGKTEVAKAASRKIMGIIEETSPVIHNIGIGKVATLVSTVATPKQHQSFLRTVSDYRNSLVKLVSPFSGFTNTAGAELHSVYDGMLSNAPSKPLLSSLTSPSSLSDRFWMDMFNECYDTGNMFTNRTVCTSHSAPASSTGLIYGSRINTYANMNAGLKGLKVPAVDKSRQERLEKSLAKIEEYVSDLVNGENVTEDGAMKRLVDAQHLYTRLSDITANSVYSNMTCGTITLETQKRKTARDHSNAILSSLLHELASLSYSEQPKLASQLALAGHVIMAKRVNQQLQDTAQVETYSNLLAAAGVADYTRITANIVCRRLTASDIKLFLGGSILEQGLFVTFLLNNVLFAQLSDKIKMKDLDLETKTKLANLVGFCESVSDAMKARHARRKINMTSGGKAFASEEAKADASFVTALYSAYTNLRRDSELNSDETVARIFRNLSSAASIPVSALEVSRRTPLPKRSSTLLDVLEGPSSVHKSFMTSFSERAAATKQVSREGGALLSGDQLSGVYDPDTLNKMRASHAYFLEEDYFSSDEEASDSEENMSLDSASGDDDYYYSSDSSEDEFGCKDGHSYDALEHLDSIATSVYNGVSDYHNRTSGNMIDIGDSDNEEYDDEDSLCTSSGIQSESASRRRAERLQYGPGFLASSFLFNRPNTSKTFLTQGKRFKGDNILEGLSDDDRAVFSDELSSSDDEFDYNEYGYEQGTLKRRPAEDQCAFVWRVMRAFTPTRVSLVNGRISRVVPVAADSVAGFYENYQKANKKDREKLKKDLGITVNRDLDRGALTEHSTGSLRRSLIKAAAYVIRVQSDNATKIHEAIFGETTDALPTNPLSVLQDTVLYSRDLKEITEKRNSLLKEFTEMSSSLFNSSSGRFEDNNSTQEVGQTVTDKKNHTRGYLAIPLHNLAGCLRKRAADPLAKDNTVGISVDTMLAIKNKNHLDWLTAAAITFARSFNVTTFHALQASLKTSIALSDMYNAFGEVVSSQRDEKIRVKNTLLDSIFRVRMSNIESILGLISPTAFVNHELPKDPSQRKNIESLALGVLRGVNSGQLSGHDIGDTSGLLTFLTSEQFAGRGGERGGLSLYRMSVTDSLSCESNNRLKGAVSLDVGKWKICDDSVFSKRSNDLVDFCSRHNIALENAVGPIGRFIPNGSDFKLVGLSKAPPMTVNNDPAMKRLEQAESGCNPGRFITASAIGNLYGKIDDIVNLAKKFAVKELVLEAGRDDTLISIEEVAKAIIQKMKTRRNKSLATGLDGTTISQATNYPALSDAIVLRAREMRDSIAAVVLDISRQYGIARSAACSNNIDGPTNVSVGAFQNMLETSVVLANLKTSLRGIENRLTAAYTRLRQFKRIASEGMSEPRAVMTSIAQTLNTLDKDEKGTRFTAADLMSDKGLFQFIVDSETKNIAIAKKYVTTAYEGACQLYAKLLSMLASAADIAPDACQYLDNSSSATAFGAPMTSRCGTLLKHPETGLWLKTDENCNKGGHATAEGDPGRAVHSILKSIQSNRDKALRSRLHAICGQKYLAQSIFTLDNSDQRSIDKIIEELGIALANKANLDRTVLNGAGVGLGTGVESSGRRTTNPIDDGKRVARLGVDDPKLSEAPLCKTIPYITVVFQNRQEELAPRKTTSTNVHEDPMDEQREAIRRLGIQESNDLSNILAIKTRHTFGSHNQAATVNIFNGTYETEPETLKKDNGPSDRPSQKSLMTGLPPAYPSKLSQDISTPLLPSGADGLVAGPISKPTVAHLREYAAQVASELSKTQEYRDLRESKSKISDSLRNLEKVRSENFFAGGPCPEINQKTMATLTQSQSEKDRALDLFGGILKQLETYMPDPSIFTVSLPVTTTVTATNTSLPAPVENNLSPSSSSSLPTKSIADVFRHAHESLKTVRGGEKIEGEAATRRLIEQEAAIRIPLLLSSHDFSTLLRELVNDFGEFYSGVEKLNKKMSEDANGTVTQSLAEADKGIASDRDSLIPVITELAKMYSNEADTIKKAVKITENKIKELELQNTQTAIIIKNLAERIEMGDTRVGVNDILDYGNKTDNDQQFLRNLKKFADDHSGPVFLPPPTKGDKEAATGTPQAKIKNSYHALMNNAIATINKGQEGVVVSYETALGEFPTPITFTDLNVQTAEKQQQKRLLSVKMFIGALEERVTKLRDRLRESSMESDDIERKKKEIDDMFRKQAEDKYTDIKINVNVALEAAQAALITDLSQSPLLIVLSGKVDRVLVHIERMEKDPPIPSTKKSTSAPSEKTNKNSAAKGVAAEQPAYSCSLLPLHEAIKRMTAIYDRDHKGPLSNTNGTPTSEADLQLMTIVDLSSSVLMANNSSGNYRSPDSVPSSIVPGLCQLCAMVVFNLHEASHESNHSFNFEGKRSRERLMQTLNAVLSGPDMSCTRNDVLTMMESDNGYIKELCFTHHQKVACLTPVNTLIGDFRGVTRPSTIILPTSELFNCPGLDYDKIRSIVYRSVDKTVADAPKTSQSIVETLARTPPNAEKLFFPHKDQSRHFNSITDAILTHMNPEATCQLNTTCDQNLVQVDPDTGLPVFVGRHDGKSRLLETKRNGPASKGGVPGRNMDGLSFVDVETTCMVAPGSLLHANKEETLRLNRLSDINNVRHHGTDVHVAGANSAWRVGEIVEAASTSPENETTRKQLLLLGSVSAIAAQKSARYSNDPTAMLNTTSAIQSLVSEAFPSPTLGMSHAGAAEAAFATQLAYRQRLFPFSSSKDYSVFPMAMISANPRYGDAYIKAHRRQYESKGSSGGSGGGLCDDLLKQSVANVSLASTPMGVLEDVSSAVAMNRFHSLHNQVNPFSFPNVNGPAVEAMTDTVVDTLSTVSSVIGRQRQPYLIPPHLMTMASSSNPVSAESCSRLLDALSRASRDASLISQTNGTSSAFNLLKAASPTTASKLSVESDNLQTTATESVLRAIIDGAREVDKRLQRLRVGRGGSGRVEANTLYRNAMTSVLQLNEDEITRDENFIETKIEKRQMREAFNELKKAMLISNDPTSLGHSNTLSAPLSVLLSRSDAASGYLRSNNTNQILNAVDQFNVNPLLVRHLLLDPQKTPVPMAKEVREILTQPKAITARALLSEACPLLSEIYLHNTRDTPPERAIDRLLTSVYFVKQAKCIDGVDSHFPAALTGAAHLMLSSMDSSGSSLLSNMKLHFSDTTSLLKNFERCEKSLGRYGDSYSMTNRQNCNCPFVLHHDFRPSVDETLVPSYAYARPEVTGEEIRNTPYQTNNLLSDKHFVMTETKTDNRMTGLTLMKNISKWVDMRMNVNFSGTYEPSRLALSNSGMTTAGVNIDVIVHQNNSKNVFGILECHRSHICAIDAKCTIAASLPSLLQSTHPENNNGDVSELVQNALPHNRYIQKSTMSASIVIFANILEQLIRDLGNVIVGELAGKLASSVSETVYANSKSMIDSLGSDALFGGNPHKSTATATTTHDHDLRDEQRHAPHLPHLVSQSMKKAIFQSLIADKMTNPENVPFASSASGPLAYDFLLSKEESIAEANAEHGAAASVAALPETSRLRNHLAHVFEAISKQVSDFEFSRILENIEAKIKDDAPFSSCSKTVQTFGRAIRQEFDKLMSFLKILRQNITPMLLDSKGKLAEKVAVYLSLLSTKSRLENLFQYGLSNTSSVDLSHLKRPNCSNNNINIEDTIMYRCVHPVLIMALYENFTALLQQEQCDAELAISKRQPLTTFLNHPNTISMANGGRAAIGAGGGNPLGLYISSHILHESTVATSDPVTDTDINFSFHSPVTRDPVMVVNPFKESAKLVVSGGNNSAVLTKDGACHYLQVSMPTDSSGLVTNTSVSSVSDPADTFKFNRRDKTPITLPRLTPSVLCSDASQNLLDVFSRANLSLTNIELRFGFMPEIITAIARVKETNEEEIIKEMSARTASSLISRKNTSVEHKTGDILIKNGTFPDLELMKVEENDVHSTLWGGKDKQKMPAKAFTSFLVNHPLASASVNGVPITQEGFLLAEEKRKRAAGITGGPDIFGSGCIGMGALNAMSNSRLMKDLEPLRKGWEEIIKLQEIFRKAATNLVKGLGGNHKVDTHTDQITSKLYNNHKTLKECKKILQEQTSLLVTSIDMLTGGYAGDLTVALVNPVREESMGPIGAISAGTRGLGHLLKRDNIAAIVTDIKQRLTLPTSGGRLIPEHNVVFKSSDDLLTDRDSIFRLYPIIDEGKRNTDKEEPLGKVMAALGLMREGHNGGKGLFTSTEHWNEWNLAKRKAIIQLLMFNPVLLKNLANSLFYTDGDHSTSPGPATNTTCALGGGVRSFPEKGTGHANNNIESLNRLFSSRLT
nr:MAG: wsv360-like protein [Metapenaeus ensis nimavirus]